MEILGAGTAGIPGLAAAAKENGNLLNQAKERAKSLIEGYVKNVGEQIGKEYTVEWVEAEE